MADQKNPLLNHLVLQSIFKYLKFRELKNIRQVSKFWNQISQPYFVQISKVKILNDDSITEYIGQCTTTTTTTTTIGLNHSNFIFENLNLDLGNVNLISKSVKELTLNKCTGVLNGFENLELLSFNGFGFGLGLEENFEIFENLRNLEVHEEETDNEILDWNLIFSKCPNLKILSAQCRNSDSLLLMLKSLSQSNLKIEDFISFLTEFEDLHLECITLSNLNLKSLDISISDQVSKFALGNLLKSQCESLKSVKIYRDSVELHSFPYDVHLKGLKSAELMGNMIESLDFLQFTPNLKQLNLNQSEEDFLVLAEKLPRSNCKNLESISIEYHIDLRVIRQLSILFENLTKISLYLNDESIRIIYSLENLKELQVFGTSLTDEGITGIPSQILMRGYKYMRDYRKHTFIGDCKKLKKFSLYPQPLEDITDSSVYHGFMLIDELTSIDLPETKISDKAVKELSQKPNLVKLSAQYLYRNGESFIRPKNIQIY